MMITIFWSLALIIPTLCISFASSQSFNPSILQDSRDLPKTDGTFGFLYRTEDGIAHAAKGDSNGVIHGRFSYTDPTGLKVNYNYNAGSRVAPGYNYDNAPAPAPAAAPRPRYVERQPQPEYNEPAPRQRPVRPRYREPQPPQYREPSANEYEEPIQTYQRRARPSFPRHNQVNEDYNYK